MRPAYLPERNLAPFVTWQPRPSRPALELAAVCFGLGMFVVLLGVMAG